MFELEDIAACIAEGRTPRTNGPYLVAIGDEKLDFRGVQLDDPVPTGRQILMAADAQPVDEHIVFQVLRNGDLEELRLEETTDLREGKVERFLVFKSAESFRIEIDNNRLEWGAYAISGRVLKRLACVPESYGVWLEMRGEQDRPIDDNELVSLEGKGLERFFTGPDQTTEGNS